MAKDRPREQWIEWIKAVEREYLAARKAVDDFLAAMNRGIATPPPKTKVRDVQAMSENLEGTYLIRLFAAFESGLRSYWTTIRRTKPAVRHLIDAIATIRGVPDDLKDEVHEVREYRNRLVHEGDDESVPVAIDAARSRLCTYFARLPDKW